jgi:hypothetical protein
MNKNVDSRDFEAMGRLIEGEIQEALDAYRAGDPEKRLRGRIAWGAGPVRTKPSLVKAAVPAVLAAALGAVLLIVITRPRALPPIDPGDIVAVLSRFPSMSRPAAEASPARRAGIAEAAGVFEHALAAAGRWKEEEERKTPVRDVLPDVPAYSMKERMKILLEDKVIERALALLTEKSKEA